MLFGFILDFEESMIGFLLWLDSIFYNVFTNLYKTFLNISNLNIFVEGSFNNIINNLYIIIGIVALFIFAMMLLRMMVDAEVNKSGKQIFDMIKRFVIVSIIIVLVPTMFNFLKDFQTSILARNVIPNFILGSSTTEVDTFDEDGNNLGKRTLSSSEASSLLLQTYANNMTVEIISGLMYPIDEEGNITDDLTINANKFFKGSTKAWLYGGLCVAGVVVGIVTVGTGTGVALVACGAGALAGNLAISGIEAVTASSYTWSYAKAHMVAYGDFSQITLFANAIQQGQMHYSAIVSTLVAFFLCYLVASFCIDVVIRIAKLTFYEVTAPICLLLSIIPQQKDLLGKWFKVVITTWAEIFLRIFLMCTVALLVGNIDFEALHLSIFHPIVSTFVICGIVIFAKSLPKIISELTGINSNNMKLNLREKLAAGSAYAVGGIIFGGAKRLSRGVTKQVKDNLEQDENGHWHRKNGVGWSRVIRSAAKGVVTSIPSVVTTQITAGISGYQAKNFREMLNAVNNANTQSEEKSEKIKKYIADHGGTLEGVGLGLITSSFEAFKNYIGLTPDYSVLKEQREAVDDISKTLKAIKSASEDYIEKHKSEFYINLSEEDIAELNYYRKLEKEGNATEQATARNWLQNFDQNHLSNRLDVIEAVASAAKSGGKNANETDEQYAARIAKATNNYNEAFKKMVDNFASRATVTRTYTDAFGVVHNVNGHYGAEKEAASIMANLGAINDKLKDYSTKAVVRTLRDGTPDGVVESTIGEINANNATKFIKELKNATEITEANIIRQYEELQRKNNKRNGKGGSN